MAQKKSYNNLTLAALAVFIIVAAAYGYLYYDRQSAAKSTVAEVEVNIKKINTQNLDTSIFKNDRFTGLKTDNYPAPPAPKIGNTKPFIEKK
jgi:hypothetical protein